MSFARLCDYCGKRITGEKTHPIAITQPPKDYPSTVLPREADLCSWDCVVMYAMRMGADKHA